MTNISAGYDDTEPSSNSPIFIKQNSQSVRLAKPSGNGILDIDFCDSSSTLSTVNKLDETSDKEYPQSKRLASSMKLKKTKTTSQWIIDHQIGISINFLILLSTAHICFPNIRVQTGKFFQLSYHNPNSGNYAIGPNDICIVIYWVVLFTALRATVMDYVLMPFSTKAGVKRVRDQARFCEQAWLLVYYSVFWTMGMYIMITSDYWLNLKNMWTNFPIREISGLSKWYTLAQYAFWLQQFLVLHVEKRRKDHWQMFAHHVVTTLLIFCSYCYHQTRVANLILCIMDVVDLFFPTAKCLKYAGYDVLCNIMFGLFMIVWVAARHIIFMMATYSVYAHSDTASPPGCYKGQMGSITGPFPPPDRYAHLLEPFIRPGGLVCWTGPVKWGFVNSLLFLQVLTLIWFSMILKVALKVLKGGKADDTRSDNEEKAENENGMDAESEETQSKEKEEHDLDTAQYSDNGQRMKSKPLGEIGAESLNFRGRTLLAYQNKPKKNTGHMTGASAVKN